LSIPVNCDCLSPPGQENQGSSRRHPGQDERTVTDSNADIPLAVSANAVAQPPEFYCSELWGGNRATEGPFFLPGLQGWVFSRPAEGGRGGDIHYISICSSGLLSRLCLADVAGHGTAIARVSDAIHRLLRRYMNTLDERLILQALNERLVGSDLAVMATAASISYLPPLRRLAVSYAGHPPAWLYRRAEQRWETVEPGSTATAGDAYRDLPLAADPRTRYTRRVLRVRPGDRLLVVTDGLLEAPSPSGEYFGAERLAAALDELRDASAVDLGRELLRRTAAFTGDDDLTHDDVTLLIADVERGPRGWGIWHGLQRRLFPRRPQPTAPNAGSMPAAVS
jgi:sigma-B regulation protein RsbU (phosphoserine phosphatase)